MVQCQWFCLALLAVALLRVTSGHSSSELRAGDVRAAARVRESVLSLLRLPMYPSSKVQAMVRSFARATPHALPSGSIHAPWPDSRIVHSDPGDSDDDHVHDGPDSSSEERLTESADRLWAHCRALSVVRVPDTAPHAAVRSYLRTALEKSSLSFEFEERTHTAHTPLGERRFTNLVATYDPSNVASRSRLVLAAHYDSKYFEDSDETFVGATDSSVPCALLLEMITLLEDRILTAKPLERPALQILFLDGEEAFEQWSDTDSLYGARQLAHEWETEDQLNGIELFVLLDLLGAEKPMFFPTHTSTVPFFQWLVEIEKSLREQHLLHAKRGTVPYFTPTRRLIGAGIEDDHVPFQLRGVPILHLIPVPFPSQWHKVTDDLEHIDRKATMDLLNMIGVFVARFLSL